VVCIKVHLYHYSLLIIILYITLIDRIVQVQVSISVSVCILNIQNYTITGQTTFGSIKGAHDSDGPLIHCTIEQNHRENNRHKIITVFSKFTKFRKTKQSGNS
jgi:hypothetical protein